ncbi:uncharacterized protein DI49_1726 [Saccharomyces eubayanus]|uniref:uncharacterized protein n=1 Tax=Saccharomyces eubayanus TaxID=1080349 RepID=UPI0006C5A5ED|nr:hypothetical protein DI49_1726 [Saccharomyces eubayanus]KOG99280.1 hypothetical protein DI49_1726 [Saccharomyces eubayanus]
MFVVLEGKMVVVDGWIVDLEEHKLVKPSRACRKKSKEHVTKLNSVPLVNWETLYDEKCALKNISNDELFKLIKCEKYEFAEMEDSSTQFVNKSFKTVNKGKYSRTYFCNCHCICIGNRRNIYLQNVPSSSNLTPNTDMLDLPIKNDDLLIEHKLAIQEFLFDENDVEILQHYNTVGESFKNIGENYLTFDYKKAVNLDLAI